MGVLDKQRVYLEYNQEQKIRINQLRVPDRPEGATVRLTITVKRDTQNRRRRAAEQAPGNNNGGNYPGGGSVGGGSGSNWNGGNNNNWNNNNNNNGGNPGNWNNEQNNNNWNGNNNMNDPSYRDELAVTVIFTVADEIKDNSDPSIKLTYGAKEDDQACQFGPEDNRCLGNFWWVKFTVQDEGSGINEVTFQTEGKVTAQDSNIYYR